MMVTSVPNHASGMSTVVRRKSRLTAVFLFGAMVAKPVLRLYSQSARLSRYHHSLPRSSAVSFKPREHISPVITYVLAVHPFI